MPYFPNSLQTVLDRSFAGKQSLLGELSGLHQSEIGRLTRSETPLTASKLEKLLATDGMSVADKHLLAQSAVRDFVGEEAYKSWFIAPQSENLVREELGGASFKSLFPLNPRAAQVIAYIVAHAHEPDTSQALELLGKFLELPMAEPEPMSKPERKPGYTYYDVVEGDPAHPQSRDQSQQAG